MYLVGDAFFLQASGDEVGGFPLILAARFAHERGELFEEGLRQAPVYVFEKGPIESVVVADQDPDAVFDAFARAVSELNPRAEVRRLSGVPPSRTDPSLPVCRAVVEAVRDARGVEPVASILGGTLPDYVFTRILGSPSVIVPYANHDEHNHAPNENLRLELFDAGIRTTLQLFDTLSRFGKGEA